MTPTLYSRNTRQTAYQGNNLDDFSKLMYSLASLENTGLTVNDIDFIIRNHHRKTLAIVEVKTRCGHLTYSQQKTFSELDQFLRNGICGGWKYLGFYVLRFQNTSFANGKAWISYGEVIDQEVTEYGFRTWIQKHFFNIKTDSTQ
jgi:hypothetical protein